MATYVNGQLGPLPRKNVERIALEAGVPPRTLQQFLGAYRWDEAQMQTRVRQIVARDHAHPRALGIIDQTSFAKKGNKTVGVKRQWCGETGKVDNCVVTVHLSYAAESFATPIDGDLYLPKDWAEDEARRDQRRPVCPRALASDRSGKLHLTSLIAPGGTVSSLPGSPETRRMAALRHFAKA